MWKEIMVVGKFFLMSRLFFFIEEEIFLGGGWFRKNKCVDECES
jgi:hypothetical protein